MNTWLTPVFIGVAAPDPQLRGTPSCEVNLTIRRAKSEQLSLLASGLRPFVCKV